MRSFIDALEIACSAIKYRMEMIEYMQKRDISISDEIEILTYQPENDRAAYEELKRAIQDTGRNVDHL